MSAETYSPDQLIAGDFQNVTDVGTILSGENLARGAVLGIVTASGKYRENDVAASDGSENAVAILVDAVDASAADVTNSPIYLSGEFNENKITLKGATVIADVKAPLRALSIFLKSAVVASV